MIAMFFLVGLAVVLFGGGILAVLGGILWWVWTGDIVGAQVMISGLVALVVGFILTETIDL